MRVVLDTSVFFAAFVSREGVCAKVTEICLDEHSVFVSEHILAELTRNLQKKSRLSWQQVANAIDLITDGTTLIEPTVVPPDAVRDQNDLAVIGTAVTASADFLITGDKDLLVIERYGTTEMVSPRQFYDRYCAGKRT
jgi:uncharacterized protein